MKSLHRAVKILHVLAEDGEGMSLTEIAKTTGIPTSSVHRMLVALRSLDLVAQTPYDRKYRLGYGLVRLAQPVLSDLSSYWNAMPWLVEVRDRWGECCLLASLVDDEVLCLQTLEVSDPNRMRFFVHPGRRMPFHCSASGKAILAYQDPEKIEQILTKVDLRAFTPRTITDKEELKRHLSVIRDQGYALCEEELEVGVSAVGVPIGSMCGQVESSITIVAPSARLQMHIRDGLLEMLKGTSERISSCLMGRG